MAHAAITTVGLTKRFERKSGVVDALTDVTIDLPAGSYVAVVGASGSGKSTLLHQLGLLDRPSAGTVLYGNIDTAALSDDERARLRRRQIGFVFQFFQLRPGLRAWENVAIPRVLDGERIATLADDARAVLDAVGLSGRSNDRPDELSGGQQQRVAIARAIASSPEVVLADEPTGALDHETALDVQLVLERLTVDQGRTLVVVTHDANVAGRALTRIELRDGRLVEPLHVTGRV